MPLISRFKQLRNDVGRNIEVDLVLRESSLSMSMEQFGASVEANVKERFHFKSLGCFEQ
jgi:hypothetical protein